MNVVDFARALIDIDSTTGREEAAGEWLAAALATLGYSVTRQPVDGGRFNVVATLGPPEVVFSTHYDCVPPFFPSRARGDRLHGRGACDAKGILAAQVAAAERFRAAGERRVGLLFLVGEERGSDGAAAANAAPCGARYLINGEPTGSRLASATRGVLRVRLRAAGRAAHSAAPEAGVSAIETLIDALVRLREIELPVDSELGATFYTVGLIEGGVAPNVIPAHASAEVLFRTVGAGEDVLAALWPLSAVVAVEPVLSVPAVRFQVPDDPPIASAVFPFTTDVAFLNRWGTPLLFGPGSFLLAHTADEHVSIAELEAAVGTYERLGRACLNNLPNLSPGDLEICDA